MNKDWREIANANENLVIIDDEGRILYGHQLLKWVMERDSSVKALEVRGITAECYIAYVQQRFGHVREVKAMAASGLVDCDLLEAVSDKIDLSHDDVEVMLAMESRRGSV
jgi:hypothetical protein